MNTAEIDTPSPKGTQPGFLTRQLGSLVGWLLVAMIRRAKKRGDWHEVSHLHAALVVANGGPRTGCAGTTHEIMKQVLDPKRDKTRADGF